MTPSPWEVWYADLNPYVGREQGHRPEHPRRTVLVVSSDTHLEVTGDQLVTILLVTSAHRGYLPFRIGLSGLPKPSWVISEQVRTISIKRFGSRVAGPIPQAERVEVRLALASFLDL